MAMTPVTFQLQPSGGPSTPVVHDKDIPVTSYACQWKPPRKRKQSNLPISDAKFVKTCTWQDQSAVLTVN